MLDSNNTVMNGTDTNEFIKLDLNSGAISILGILNQEHHQKGYDGGAGIDHQLPCIGEPEQWPAYSPNHDDEQRQKKGARSACGVRTPIRGFGEELAHPSNRRFVWFWHVTPPGLE